MAIYSSHTDEDLVALLRDGDERAFAAVYMRYREPLAAAAFNFTGNREDALDVTQDIFAALWKLRGELVLTHSLKAYLYQGVRNGCLRKAENNLKARALLESLKTKLEEAPASLESQVDSKETSRMIDTAIAAMPGRMQQVFRLSREAGLSHAEIGKHLNISPNTVKVTVHNALKLIRSHLGDLTGSSLLFLVHLFK